MTPRKLHLLFLAVLCAAPVGFGAFLFIKGERSHSDLSGIAVAAGLALIAGSAIYATLSSLLVWKFGTTPRRVFTVHGGLLGIATALYGVPRFLHLVTR